VHPRGADLHAADAVDAKARRRDRLDRIARAVTATAQSGPDTRAVEALLHARLASPVGPDVLEHAQLATWLEHTPQLRQRARLTWHRTQHQARDRGVEAGGLEPYPAPARA
jgi:hypothetical protein